MCREMFVYTFGIPLKRISTALTKLRSSSVVDKRGIAGGHNKISPEALQSVIEHIKKLPKYKSHYCREKTDREYLPQHMTLQLTRNVLGPVSKTAVVFHLLDFFGLGRS